MGDEDATPIVVVAIVVITTRIACFRQTIVSNISAINTDIGLSTFVDDKSYVAATNYGNSLMITKEFMVWHFAKECFPKDSEVTIFTCAYTHTFH